MRTTPGVEVGGRYNGQYLITHLDSIPDGTIALNLNGIGVPVYKTSGFWYQNGVSGGVISTGSQYKVLHVPEPLSERDQLIEELDHVISSAHVKTALETVADFILENFQRKTGNSDVVEVFIDNDGERWFRNDDGTYRYDHARPGSELYSFTLPKLQEEYGPLEVEK